MSKIWIYINNSKIIIKVLSIIFGFLSASLFLQAFFYFMLFNPIDNPFFLLWSFPLFVAYGILCMTGLTYFSCRNIELV
jgi:hypothetical protein